MTLLDTPSTPPAAGRSGAAWLATAVLGLVLVAGHVTSLPASLEDIDSVNFALGVRRFDVAAHRPHPPGYPAYIAFGKAATAITRAAWPDGLPDRVEARALGALSLLAALLAVPLALWTFGGLTAQGSDRTGRPVPGRRAVIATVLLVTCPLFWYMAARPMSDMPGLAAALAAQAALACAYWRQRPLAGDRRLTAEEMAASGRLIVMGALLAGLSMGFRSQTLWLTGPLLLLVIADRLGRGAGGALLGSLMTFAIGAVAWAIPLVVASGGPQAYLAALGSQAGEDFAGVDMLSLNPSLRLLAFTLLRTFVWPWEHEALAAVVLVLAAIGAAVLLVSERRTLTAVAAISLPYLAFHLAFQDTTFARYALPLVPPTVFLAACALDALGRVVAVTGTAAVAGWALWAGVPVQQAYAQHPSPPAQAFDALAGTAAIGDAPVVAMHFPFKRPLEAETRDVGRVIAPTPRKEWLDVAAYWQEGGAAPLWFVADPARTDLALIDPQARCDVRRFAWPVRSLSMFGGMRPQDVALYKLAQPGWFLTEGWALTPEAAGMARLMGKGPHLGPIVARVRRRPGPATLLVGGRNLGGPADPAVRFTLRLDGQDVEQWEVAPNPGFFLRTIALPAGRLAGDGGWAELTLASTPVSGEAPVASAIEQFDLQDPGTTLWGFGTGWHEAELDPVRARAWRWMSARAEIEIPQMSGPSTLVLRGESPLASFDGPSTLVVKAGERQLARIELSGDFTVRVGLLPEVVAASGGRVTLETSQTFVPAERGSSADPRHLGLRLLEVSLDGDRTAGSR